MKIRSVGAWTVAIVIALMALGLYVQGRRLRAAELQERTERAAKQDAALDAANWKRAADASQAELAEKLPRLKRELDVAKAEQARLLLATHFEGKADTIRVPGVCSATADPGAGEAPPLLDAPAGDSGAALSTGIDIAPWVRLDEAVVADELGRIYVARNVDVQLQVGSWYSGWRPVEPTNLDAPTSHVDPELTDALAAWRAPKPPRIDLSFRSPRDWRGGWSCVAGGGITVTGSPAAGVFCGVGPQF